VIGLPSGYEPESVPQQQDIGLPYARYQSASVWEGKALVSERALDFNAIFVKLPEYPDLKNFMAQTLASDEQQVVLRAGVVNNAQKIN
jgi:hypothetical protein